MFYNLTNHVIKIKTENGEIIINKSGNVARVNRAVTRRFTVDGVPSRAISQRVEGVPEPQDGIVYIVSSMVRHALPGRNDIASPSLVINTNGRVEYCDGLVMNEVNNG